MDDINRLLDEIQDTWEDLLIMQDILTQAGTLVRQGYDEDARKVLSKCSERAARVSKSLRTAVYNSCLYKS